MREVSKVNSLCCIGFWVWRHVVYEENNPYGKKVIVRYIELLLYLGDQKQCIVDSLINRKVMISAEPE